MIQPEERCAWCGVIIRSGSLPASHGICPPCGVKFQAEADALNNPK